MRLLKLIPAALLCAVISTGAQAAVHISSFQFDTHPAGPGEVLINNFDGIASPDFTFSGGTIRIGKNVNSAQQPFGDLTHYEAAQSGNPFIITGPELSSLSLYIGSLDTYNAITFKGAGGFSQTINGLTLGAPANGDITNALTNRQFFFHFDAGDRVNQVIFTTGQPAFEFDNIYARVAGVPEPAVWTMLIMGFGTIGFMLRRQRETMAFASH